MSPGVCVGAHRLNASLSDYTRAKSGARRAGVGPKTDSRSPKRGPSNVADSPETGSESSHGCP